MASVSTRALAAWQPHPPPDQQRTPCEASADCGDPNLGLLLLDACARLLLDGREQLGNLLPDPLLRH
eukprot:3787446-Rhodomonas_salina.1